MLFNSFQFLVFFPICCILYFVIPKRIKALYLLAVSYGFYMCWNPKYALLLLFSTAVTYAAGIWIGKANEITEEKKKVRAKKWAVAAAFLINLGILFFFKYFDFAFQNVSRVLAQFHISLQEPVFDIVMPAGISFYTFKALSYVVDVYREKLSPEKNFLHYGLYVSFFLEMAAGPIDRAGNLLRQIKDPQGFQFERVRKGLLIMLVGFIEKVVISDNAAIIVNTVYDNYTQYSGWTLGIASLLFAVQIFGDFAGYSSIALGAGKVMGFDMIDNFNAPYFSDSVADFWRRWHISLSTWFRDYLYIPLGGNRKGRIRKYFNIMVVFLASGLWHGASWHYVIWGALNGVYQIIGDLTKGIRDGIKKALHIDTKKFSYRIFQIGITFLLIDVSWVFFRATGVRDALRILKNTVTVYNPWVLFDKSLFSLGLGRRECYMLVIFIILLIIKEACKYKKVDWMEALFRQNICFRWIVYFSLIFALLIFGCYGSGFDAGQFIYSQF